MPRRSFKTDSEQSGLKDFLLVDEMPTRASKRKLEEILKDNAAAPGEAEPAIIIDSSANAAKRGRGRPKATRNEEVNDSIPEEDAHNDEEDTKPQQKRGRKKKEAVQTSDDDVAEAHHEEKTTEARVSKNVEAPEAIIPKRIKKKQRTDSDDDEDLSLPVNTSLSTAATIIKSNSFSQKSDEPSTGIKLNTTVSVTKVCTADHVVTTGANDVLKTAVAYSPINNTGKLPTHHSGKDLLLSASVSTSAPTQTADGTINNVARSSSESNLSQVNAYAPNRIPKKKREVDAASMTAEEVEDASMPAAKVWASELEDKVDSCEVLREGKFRQNQSIKDILEEINPECLKLHELIKKARNTPALIAAQQEMVSMGLSMNGGTFLNAVNSDQRAYAVRMNICPYGEALDTDGREINNMHLAWMNAAALEDHFIQQAAATQAVLDDMKQHNRQPSIDKACEWWGIRDGKIINKELKDKKIRNQVHFETVRRLQERPVPPPPPPPAVPQIVISTPANASVASGPKPPIIPPTNFAPPIVVPSMPPPPRPLPKQPLPVAPGISFFSSHPNPPNPSITPSQQPHQPHQPKVVNNSKSNVSSGYGGAEVVSVHANGGYGTATVLSAPSVQPSSKNTKSHSHHDELNSKRKEDERTKTTLNSTRSDDKKRDRGRSRSRDSEDKRKRSRSGSSYSRSEDSRSRGRSRSRSYDSRRRDGASHKKERKRAEEDRRSEHLRDKKHKSDHNTEERSKKQKHQHHQDAHGKKEHANAANERSRNEGASSKSGHSSSGHGERHKTSDSSSSNKHNHSHTSRSKDNQNRNESRSVSAPFSHPRPPPPFHYPDDSHNNRNHHYDEVNNSYHSTNYYHTNHTTQPPPPFAPPSRNENYGPSSSSGYTNYSYPPSGDMHHHRSSSSSTSHASYSSNHRSYDRR